MALLIIGSVAAIAGTAAYATKKSTKSHYRNLVGEMDPRFEFEDEQDPERIKSLTRFHSIDVPEILVGWRVRLPNGREGVVVNCRSRFMRASVFDIALEGKSSPEPFVLNRKNKTDKRKYVDFDLIRREF